MVSKRLVDYIHKVTRKGMKLEEAENRLIKAGHNRDDVTKAVSDFRKKKIEIIGVVVLVLIIIFGVVGLILDKSKVPEPQLSSYDKLLLAIESGDISACDQFNPVKKDVCRRTITGELGGDNPPNLPFEEPIIQQAAELQDPSLCDQIGNSIQKNRCLYGSGGAEPPKVERYVFDPVTNETVPTEYQVIEDITDEAAVTGNSSLCDQIDDPAKKYRCQVKAS